MVFNSPRRFQAIPLAIPLAVLAQLVTSPLAKAIPESVYKEALQLAQKKAIKNQTRMKARLDGLSPTLVKDMYGRQYNPGDSWDVASWQFRPSSMRKTGEVSKLSSSVSNGGIFHYEALRPESGSEQQLTLKITQVNLNGFTPVDPRIDSLSLHVDRSLSQSKKSYLLRGHSSGLSVSPEGVHSGMTPLELYPLDFPDLVTADRKTPTSLPVLPDKIQDAANRLGFRVDLSRSKWFEQDDFFGRPIGILWQDGDPWPAYIKTPGGISILIHKGDQ